MNARDAKILVAYLTGRLSVTETFLALGWEPEWPRPPEEMMKRHLSDIIARSAEVGERSARELLLLYPDDGSVEKWVEESNGPA